MTLLGQCFSSSDCQQSGVSCGEDGVFVGDVPLLERDSKAAEFAEWRPRRLSVINCDLSERYGLPVDFGSRIAGLAAVARALQRKDLLHAQIATLHLQIPDPPALTKSVRGNEELFDVARRLRISGLLKADWDALKHPRWPAGSPEGTGGRVAPVAEGADISVPESRGSIVPAQITVPAPFDFPAPGTIPFPPEVVTPPVISPRDGPRNPYPDRPECEQEWAEAVRFCKELMRAGRLGAGDYRGMGRTLYQCIMGQVSEDCGGNSISG